MIKRLTWFVTGAVTGAAGSGYARRKMREAAAQLTPRNVAKSGAIALRRRGREVVDSVRAGRSPGSNGDSAARSADDPATIADRIAPDEEILVDGRPVDRGRIVVMRPRR
ncbi:MAG: hypothetical protein M3337_00050 [Actinomycetota bacterium]|nr:hypothetical protein [Actinomycetota bacterium]